VAQGSAGSRQPLLRVGMALLGVAGRGLRGLGFAAMLRAIERATHEAGEAARG
jgi:hypothetical protein